MPNPEKMLSQRIVQELRNLGITGALESNTKQVRIMAAGNPASGGGERLSKPRI